jgi:hypothetical protein
MREVHPMHEPHLTWSGFFVHIATIVVGLFIAVCIDKTVEGIHHHFQRTELEAQMRQVFLDDLDSDTRALHELRLGRDYLADLLAAITSRVENRAEKAAAPDVRRLGGYTISPNLAPFDVAKLNGTAAFLPGERLRIFNRIAFALELLANARRDLYAAMDRLGAFHIRYVDSRGSIQAGERVPGPDLDRLTAAELQEYRATVSTLAKGYDVMIERLRLFDFEATEILAGTPSEKALIGRLREVWGRQGRDPEPVP